MDVSMWPVTTTKPYRSISNEDQVPLWNENRIENSNTILSRIILPFCPNELILEFLFYISWID